MKAKLVAALLTGAAMMIAAPMWAGTVTFDLGSCAEAGLALGCSVAGPTLTYTSGGQTLGASGHNGVPNSDLYVKNAGNTGGPGETGLGMAADTANHEIQTTDFVNLDLSSLVTNGFTTATVTIESIQSGEGGEICFGTTIGSLGSNCVQLLNPPGGTVQSDTFALNSSDDVVGITAVVPPGGSSGSNVLIASEVSASTVTPAPEPASMLLFGSGLLGLGGYLRRRFKA